MIDYKDIDKPKKTDSSYSLKSITAIVMVFFLVFTVFFGAYFYALYTQKNYVLHYVAISGNHILDAEKIKSITLTNKATCLSNHDEEKIYSNLIISPWIKRAYVAKIYPDTIYIKILERKPACVVQLNDRLYIMDMMGNIIDTYKKELNLNLSSMPLIVSNKSEYVNQPFLIKAIYLAYRKLDKLNKINYIEIISDSRQLVHYSNGLDIVLNSLDCPDKAFEHLESQWGSLVKKRKRLESVSICFADKFVLSWKKEKKGGNK